MKLGLAAFLVVGSLTTCSFACKCAPPPAPKEALKESSAVFSAVAVKIKEGERENVIVLKVQKSWKGVQQEMVFIYTPSSSAACGVSFADKSEWLVYASEDPETKKLRASICSRTKLLEEAKEDLEELGEPTWKPSSP